MQCYKTQLKDSAWTAGGPQNGKMMPLACIITPWWLTGMTVMHHQKMLQLNLTSSLALVLQICKEPNYNTMP